MWNLGLGKYRTMVISIALFLLFDLGVLVMNFFISSEISSDAANVNIVGRQRMLTQRMAKASLQIESRVIAGQSYRDLMMELDRASAVYDQTLMAYINGGTVPGTGSGDFVVKRIDDEKAQKMLADAQEQWAPYRDAIQAFVRSDAPTLEQAMDVARNSEVVNVWLLTLMNDLTTRVEELAASKATVLRTVQLTGMLLATINFLIIMFHFIRHLRRSDQALERAHRETDDILRTTQEGLFLLDADGRVGSQQSRALAGILGVQVPPGSDFLDVLRPLVTPKVFDTAREYIDLLLRHEVREKLVAGLNPLDSVEITVTRGPGMVETRFLQFRFNRVMEGEVVTHLLVTTNDISRRVRLERDLRESEVRAQGQMSVLLQILGVEPHLLQDFLRNASEGLNLINQQLELQPAPGENLLTKVNAIFRIAHRIKGDAAAVGLESVAQSFHGLEDMLSGMRERGDLVGEDFLPVAVRMKALFSEIETIHNVLTRMAQMRGVVTVEPARPKTEPSAVANPIVRQWISYAKQLAERHGKQVDLVYQGMDVSDLHPVQREAVSSIVNQFVRNALVHGIERPEDRKARGKAESGRLAVYVANWGENGIEVSFRDDGQGIDQAKLRAAVVRSGRMNEEEVGTVDMRRLVSFIFEPGISTRETADEDAGRGAGLDAVRDLVRKLGGQIRIGMTTGEYCHFRVQLPPVHESLVSVPAITSQEAAA